ncbi:N-acetylmuramoyl-L-alanine amidase [Aquabacter sp. L1I39]|uniref:N-acetylmuramoyl-L-alanine amidase n=1 Tax=Aquabacter sp. L1I39 TaxID=2820278 RepID=UPI001ADBB6D6|nr:N-acetylmuramoyl-L-alanine amidase [Aquabacter sp. L1I39]QTL03520.1 N-acetylmuramoyl-L-alanine amidase [Aquabacter sp. L1I39]
MVAHTRHAAQVRNARRARTESSGAADGGFVFATPYVPAAAWLVRAFRHTPRYLGCRSPKAAVPALAAVLLAVLLLATPLARAGEPTAPPVPADAAPVADAASVQGEDLVTGSIAGQPSSQPGAAKSAVPPAPAQAAVPDTSAAQAPDQAAALDARLAGDGQRTRLILDLSKPAEFRAFTLANPYRVILDLTDVTFTLAETRVQTRRGLVSSFRYGVLAPGKARMVLDVTEPVMIDKAFVLPPAEGQPARLVLDLVRTDAATFNTTVATAAEARGAPSAALAPAPAADGDVRPVIVLDPGHGGIDSGTSGASSFNEKNIVLDVALALRTELERSGRYRVVMTRSTDVFVPLGERVQIARANRAALFISIHADALARDDGSARGASVYTLSETASDADAAHLAEKENKADLIAGVDLSEESDEVAGILFDLAQRETRNFSATFARNMVGAMKSVGRVHKAPLKSAGFKVLKAHDVPSVLVELGYMSSKEDLKLLTSDAWREKLAQAMAGAIDDFFAPRLAGVGPTGASPRPAAGK